MEAPEGGEWGWYSPHQIPTLIAWLETGSQQEQQLAEDVYTMYQPVLKIVMPPKQVSCSCFELAVHPAAASNWLYTLQLHD